MAESKAKKDVFGRVVVWRDDLLQGDVAAWNRAYVQMPRVGVAEQRQAALQAAIVAGWILEPACEATQQTDMNGKARTVYTFDGVAIDQMTAAEVMHYGGVADALYVKLTTVPDAKNS